jgi:hypothetical protein
VNPLAIALAVLVSIYVAVFVLGKAERLAVVLVLSMFVTRFTIDIAGFSVRLETVGGLLAALSLLLGRGRSKPLSTPALVSIIAIVTWLLGGLLSSVVNSPELSRSLSILSWCVLSVVAAIWIAKNPTTWLLMLRVGLYAAFGSLVLAVVFWSMASAGIAVVGVQVDPTYGGYAAFVGSIEANVLAGLLCLWGLIAAWNPLSALSGKLRVATVLLTPVAILATHTRAALVAYVVGLVFIFVGRRSARRLVAGTAVLGSVIVGALLSSSSDVGLSKFGSLFDVAGGTGNLRLGQNSIALHEWATSPSVAFGLGWNSYGQRHLDLTRPFENLPSYIGNLPTQLVYDGGLLAAIAVAVAALIVVVTLFARGHFWLVVSIAVPYAIFSIATSVLWLLETWFWVGLAWGLLATRPEETAPTVHDLAEVRRD